ncbi:hypothetical protein B0T18DRAFT_427308 [Schizothecium vesticola]|uniref:Myb-like domain-containing protein n=1 Tax=Schizothecium vesticola TaxID=314040 RepID=A0AA40F140_9PEZI|nr:hypothetical protein B0T18DRAFT_427308 [Schizothecium vesticola]
MEQPTNPIAAPALTTPTIGPATGEVELATQQMVSLMCTFMDEIVQKVKAPIMAEVELFKSDTKDSFDQVETNLRVAKAGLGKFNAVKNGLQLQLTQTKTSLEKANSNLKKVQVDLVTKIKACVHGPPSETPHTGTISWHKVATHLPGRNNKSCRKRWHYSVAHTIRKGTWSKEEDAKLLEAVDKDERLPQQVALTGQNWSEMVTKHFPNRTSLSAKNRYSILLRKQGSRPSATPNCTHAHGPESLCLSDGRWLVEVHLYQV